MLLGVDLITRLYYYCDGSRHERRVGPRAAHLARVIYINIVVEVLVANQRAALPHV